MRRDGGCGVQMEKEPERMDSDAIRRTVRSLGDGGCGGVQMEKEPERMDADAIRRTVQSLGDGGCGVV